MNGEYVSVGGALFYEDGTGSFSKDVMAFSLHYYQGDYTPIGGVALNPACSIAYSSAAAKHLYDDLNRSCYASQLALLLRT